MFFFVCHINQSRIVIINGFQIRTNNEKIIIWITLISEEIWIFDHNKTKKITRKKSFIGFILLVISNLYEELAKVTPAINAQISIQNHK